ncbi:hypothetical protein [uncultured Stenotrophomonas sp.]|uniref:hypothetical protein n=1 Tax=uncultured Stenotrophomonas sp. TaxID=165438 RepID=UPI00258D6925|nr:hypothetical protein [uncultured Stenotrophomonas sp.]
MDYEDIRAFDVELFAARTRFRALIWADGEGRFQLREIRLESGEVLPGQAEPLETADAAKQVAREAVERWLSNV